MKKILLPLLLVLIVVSLGAIESTISAVTVYADRAQITRSANTYFTKGEHKILFDDLPQTIEQNSIQANGKGNAIIRDVTFKTEQFAEITDETKKALSDKLQQLQYTQKELNDKTSQASNLKQVVVNILAKLTSTSEETENVELDPEKWIKMVEFYRTKQAALDQEIRETDRSKRELIGEIDKVSRELQELGQLAYKYKNMVEILVDVKKDGNLKLDLSYIVYGPSWTPVYDLRVDSEYKTMHLTYKSNIFQTTGEDWKNVDLKLSTAKPNISSQPPELYPQYISIYSPQPMRGTKQKMSARSGMSNEMATSIEGMTASRVYQEMDMLDIEHSVSTVESGATSVVFDIDGSNTIKSDNEPHMVTITIQEFPAGFRYSAIPKNSQFAYLKAKVKNDSDYPFLPGDTNVFLDNNFVANSYLKAVAPTEEFWTFLGVDESIKVEYKFVKKYDETGGIFVEKNKKIFEYLIKITNNKKTQEEIVVWDQLPISQNEKIKVKLIEPNYKDDTEILKINEHKYVEWFFNPKPGEKLNIPFKFSVEYPIGTQIKGL
ncbi:MAG: mucoidy inhibitor MuiA family protein [Candidatus Tenebribacter davisii]|nr:mucoidy inhibitor MuiA family protein [Candidatus Tenebribacter davisii]